MAEEPKPDMNEERELAARRVPAYALLRAMVMQDIPAAALVIREAADRNGLAELAVGAATVGAQAMLAAEGYDVAKVVKAIDHWLQVSSEGLPRFAA